MKQLFRSKQVSSLDEATQESFEQLIDDVDQDHTELVLPTAQKEPFVLCTGESFSDVSDLLNRLKHVSSEEFVHHVTPKKNDFADYFAYVGEKALSSDFRQIRTLTQLQAYFFPPEDSLEQSIDSLDSFYASFVSSTRSQLHVLREKQELCTRRFNDIDSSVSHSLQKISDLLDHFDSLKVRCEELEESITAKVDEYTNRFESLSSRNIVLQKKFDELHSKEVSIEEQISAVDSSLHAIKSAPSYVFENTLRELHAAINNKNSVLARELYSQARDAFYALELDDSSSERFHRLLVEAYHAINQL